MHNQSFNTYIESDVIDFWRDLCLREGELISYDRGDSFFIEGEIAPYIGFIESGTLKYVVFDDDGREHVMGLEFAGEFVADFPFSLRREKARASVVASSPCKILCVSTRLLGQRLAADSDFAKIVADTAAAVFGMVYDRYKALYTLSPQQRYNDLISRHPDLFSLFPLRDIASFLKVTPTHLSRLRKNI